MDREQLLLEAGRLAGVRPEAEPDYLRRALEQFPVEVDLGQVAPWVRDLKPEAPHLFTTPQPEPKPGVGVRPEHQHLSAEERLTRYRPKATKLKQPQAIAVTPAEAAELAGLNPTARLSRYRALQAQRQR